MGKAQKRCMDRPDPTVTLVFNGVTRVLSVGDEFIINFGDLKLQPIRVVAISA
jgi:hypothetical protein